MADYPIPITPDHHRDEQYMTHRDDGDQGNQYG